jgi:hypothetical protein
MKRSGKEIRRIILYTITFLLLFAFSINHRGHLAGKTNNFHDSTNLNIVEKGSEKEMSAIKFTALPFILAFKHFILDREE